MKISSYCYLFNAKIREFDLDGMVANFTAFFDETVVATIPSKDDTYERLLAWQEKLGLDRLRVVMTTIQLSNNRFDGDLKTAALQACTKSTHKDPRVYVIIDGDERIPLSQRTLWTEMAERCYHHHIMDGFLVHVIDLWGDEHHIRANHPPGVKFRMHKDTVVRRGVVPEAERGNGLFDTSVSDSTEPLNSAGRLARFVPYYPPQWTDKLALQPYVLHYGHIDQQRRAKLNREFWREHWKARSGEEPTMALEASEPEHLIEHGLPLS